MRPNAASMIRSSWTWKSICQSSAEMAMSSSAGRHWPESQQRPLTPNGSVNGQPLHEVAVKDRLNLVLQPRPLPDQLE